MKRTLTGLAVAAALALTAAGCDTKATTAPSGPVPKDEGKRNSDAPPPPNPAPPK